MIQRIFRRHFNIHRNDSVASRNTVLLWVRNFRERQLLQRKGNLAEENLQLELLRTSNECVRLLSEVLSDQQAEMQLR
jgi:transposase-like protein